MKHLLKTISLFLILLLTIPNTFGNTTIYEGEYLKVYNIFYNAFSDNSEKELNAKLDEVYRLIHLQEFGGMRELLYVIKNSLGDLIYEKYPKDTSCDDILGPGGKLYEYDYSVGESDNISASVRNQRIKRGDVISIKVKMPNIPFGMFESVSSFHGGNALATNLITITSKYKCDITSKDNIYSGNGNSVNITTLLGTYKKEFSNFSYDVFERDRVYYITVIDRKRNLDGSFGEYSCPEGKTCGSLFIIQSATPPE